MPFPSYHSMVTAVAQNLRKSSDSVIEVAFIPRHASLRSSGIFTAFRKVLAGKVGPLDEISESSNMMIRACQDHGSCGRASSGGVKASKSNTIFAELVNVGSTNLSTKASGIGEAEVISDDDEKIGLLGGSHGRSQW